MRSKKRQAVIVLGMHRSGTSATAGAFGLLGAALPRRPLPTNEFNPKGYFESSHLLAIHDRILAAADTTWSGWEGISEKWLRSADTQAFVDELAAAVAEDYGTAPLFVIKDPRMCRLMPLWQRVLDQVGAKPYFVLPIRNPVEVAESLRARDGMPLGQGALLWLRHVLDAERETRGKPRGFFHYPDLLSKPRNVIDRLTKMLGIAWPRRVKDALTELHQFLDPELRNQIAKQPDFDRLGDVATWVSLAYESLQRLVESPTDRAARISLDRLGEALAVSSGTFSSIFTHQKEQQKIEFARRERDLKDAHQGELAGLRAIVAERDNRCSILTDELGSRERKLAGLEFKANEDRRLIEALQNDLAERTQKVAALEAALETAIAERDRQLDRLRDALAEIEREIAARRKAENEVETASQSMQDRDAQVKRFRIGISERDARIASINQALADQHIHIVALQDTISEIFASDSWQITAPGRWVGRQLRRALPLVEFLMPASSHRPASMRVGDRAKDAAGRLSEGVLGPGLYSLPAVATRPKVSVIVPNYNHKPYLRDRLESIYNQTYDNFEVILLDDCSTDGSQEVLRQYAKKYVRKTKLVENSENSGGVFNQWKKGLDLASGDLIWIAESDDYCSTNLLEDLTQYFANPAVMLAFCRSDFVKGENLERIWTTEDYWKVFNFDLGTRPVIKSAHWLVNHGWGIRNIVPNASSALFRRHGALDGLDNSWTKLRLCGDWIFYLTHIRGGLVAYSPESTNYYRQHALGTSTNVQKSDDYYREYERVARTIASLYRLDNNVLERQRDDIYTHWKTARGDGAKSDFNALYDLDRVREFVNSRKPNIIQVAYALAPGGGETFPILLANRLDANGYCVTLLNAAQEPTQAGVREMLSQNIPLLEVARTDRIAEVLVDIGAEIVHTHHANMDLAFSGYLVNEPDIRQVVSMHGMYEMMDPEILKARLPLLEERVDCFVYAAEKNLAGFPVDFRANKKFVRIDNALPVSAITPALRSDLGIEPDAFVLCQVARGIPQKGWKEAIQAVTLAKRKAKRKIHLLLIGDGPEYDRLKSEVPSFIHCLGFRSNIRDYFAASDIGFLPSRFKGESYPLVLIDCLLAGRPMLASNIGEIASMLAGKDGPAGELFDLVDWTIPVEALADRIAALANDHGRYQTLAARVPDAAAKFDMTKMVEKYDAVYRDCLKTGISAETKAARNGSILLVTHDCFPHGAQVLLLQIGKTLKRNGFDLRVLALGDGPLFDEFARLGPIIHAASAGEIRVKDFLFDAWTSGMRDAIASTVVCGSILPVLKDLGFNVLHLVHELPNLIRLMGQEENAKAVARYADKVVFASKAVCESFGTIAPIASDKVVIRPQGLLRKNPYKDRNAEALREVCQKHGLPANTKIVLSIGYVQPRKGPDLFVQAAALVLKKRRDTAFIWVGDANQETQAQITELVDKLGVRERVLFVGYDAEPMAYYAAASAYALTSREDPFPNVAIESIEVGVPVVAFDGATGAADYILAHGGALARNEDAADFAKRLIAFLDNPQPLKKLNSVGSLQQYTLDLLHALNGFPRVSVVVPNFNYGRLLPERLDGIYRQFMRPYEVVILDDASTDSSAEVIKTYLARNDVDAKVMINETNSGSVFRQWQRGADLCSGDLIWIAEVDDLAGPDFLRKLSRAFDDPDVVLAYSDSKQIDETGRVFAENYLDYTRDISDRWHSNYTRSGSQEIADSMAIKNTIPNVSAVVFRRTALQAALNKIGDILFSYKVAGDWLVYLHVLTQGRIHFRSETLNYHRKHSKSVTLGTDNMKHYREVEELQQIARSLSTPSAETRAKAAAYMERLYEHFEFPRKNLRGR